jgi:hypothetical protein
MSVEDRMLQKRELDGRPEVDLHGPRRRPAE